MLDIFYAKELIYHIFNFSTHTFRITYDSWIIPTLFLLINTNDQELMVKLAKGRTSHALINSFHLW